MLKAASIEINTEWKDLQETLKNDKRYVHSRTQALSECKWGWHSCTASYQAVEGDEQRSSLFAKYMSDFRSQLRKVQDC